MISYLTKEHNDGIKTGRETQNVVVSVRPCVYVAEIWLEKNIYIFLIFPWKTFIIKSGWLFNFSHYIGVFVLVYPLSFYYSITIPWVK